MTMLPIILLILISSFDINHAALTCYGCNPCGTEWNAAVATVIQTSGVNDYCRKTVTGTLVVKDSASTCNPVNVLNNGVYCCQADLCNSANKYSFNFSFILIIYGLILYFY